MSSSTVSKKANQDAAAPAPHSGFSSSDMVDSREHSTKASASAGLNLNVLGAVSGVFSGKSKKEIAKDGSSTEWRDDKTAVDGVGGGNASAVGAADIEESKKSHQGAMADKSFF